MSTIRDRGHDDALLGAALLAQTGTADGPRPTLAELTAWAAGALDEPRLAQVESHIAHDPAVFASAMAARRQRQAGGSTPAARRRPRRLLPLALSAAAAVVLAVTVLLLPQQEHLSQPEAADPVLRSTTAPHPDWRVAAFRAGYDRTANAQALAPGAGIVTIDHCMDGDDCARLAAELTGFGRALASIEARCGDGGLDAAGAAEAAARIRKIDAAVAGSLELTAWRGHLQALADNLQSGPQSGCDASRRLVLLLTGN